MRSRVQTNLAGAVVAAMLGSACVSSSAMPNIGLRVGHRPLEIQREIVTFRLDSGLRVALVPDARTNLVSVDVRYATGALDDLPGRSGLAHLAEHLSFEIAETGGATVAQRLDEVALVYSASTKWDETHFASLALAPRLADVLAIEATRMAGPCERIAPEVLERERDVVDNELRGQRALGLWAALAPRLFPGDHPFGRPVTSAELGEIRLADVCRFLAGHYAPGRAILVLSGAIELGSARALVIARFGAIRRASAAARPLPPVVPTAGESQLGTAVEQPTAVIAFPASPTGLPGHATRALAIDLWVRRILQLGSGAGVRDVERGFLEAARGGIELVIITARDAGALREAVDVAFGAQRRLLDGEFALDRRDLRALRLNDGLSALDRFEGLGARVADSIQHGGRADGLLARLRELEALWPDRLVREVHDIGMLRVERFVDLSAGSIALVRAIDSLPARGAAHVAYLVPGAAGAGGAGPPDGGHRIDVAEWRAPVDLTEAQRPLVVVAGRRAPRLREAMLASGLRVVLAPVPGSAVVDARLLFPAGLAHEPPETPGVAALAALLLEHDIARDYSESDRLRASWALGLGGKMTFEVGPSSTVFRLSGAARYADWHVWRLFWLVERGVYTDESLARVRDADVAPDDRERRLRRALAGALLGGVTIREQDADAPERIGRGALEEYRRRSYVPGGATLMVVGGFDADRMLAQIQDLTARWRGKEAAPRTHPAPRLHGGPRYLALPDDESPQVSIALAFPAPGDTSAARLVAAEMVDAQAQSIRRRIGATYGLRASYTILVSAAPALMVAGDADPARAGDVLVALLRSLDELRADGDAFRRAFVIARRRVLGRVLAQVADTAALAAELETRARAGWTGRNLADLVTEVAALTPAIVAAALSADLDRDRMVIGLAGPRVAIEAALRASRLPGILQVR